MPAIKGRYWLATLHTHTAPDWEPQVTEVILWIKGQKEIGTQTEREHWQFVFYVVREMTLNQVKLLFPITIHLELSRSPAANAYVHKDDTAVPDSKFELGQLPMRRNVKTDWDLVRRLAKNGEFDRIPSDVYIRYRPNLRAIHIESERPTIRNNMQVKVFWGHPGTGKTHRAIAEAEETGEPYFVKNSRTKWWDGYQGEPNVIFDEFSGDAIDVDYCKRWWDKFPCLVEYKGGSTILKATRFWITSNIHPDFWFRNVDQVHRDAIMRRIHVIEEMYRVYEAPVYDDVVVID
jgi:hypothetical protein